MGCLKDLKIFLSTLLLFHIRSVTNFDLICFQYRLLYEKDQLLQEIHGTLFMFDTELKALYDKKVQLDVDLKNADLR